MVLEIVIFFALLLVTTMIIALLPGTISGRLWITLPVCALALAATAAIFVGIEHDGPGASALGLSAILLMLVMRGLQPQWSFLGAQLFVAVAVASLSYLVYAAFQTFLAGLPVVGVIASVLLLFFETCALLLSISFTFEICDVLARKKRPRVVPPLTRLPWVALQVPSYNEPVEVVRPTLEALARVNYPNLIIQVVDNNTTDEAVWRPLEQLCHELGPRFAFVHLEDWPGFKAGALNESTKYLPEEVEILGIVDADYRVHPQWLQDTIGHFDDPAVAFVQTSQHYRDREDNPYLRGLFYSFRYFFDLTMPARNHRNAIIFCGTMGLIRRSAFSEIGGWNEACITEDAEASLRMLGAGYKGIYDSAAYGEGLMPLNFDGLKKQRFRWALGGVQILKFHWRELIPLPPPDEADNVAADPLSPWERAVVRGSAHGDLHDPSARHGACDGLAPSPPGATVDRRCAGNPAGIRGKWRHACTLGDAAGVRYHVSRCPDRTARLVCTVVDRDPRLPAWTCPEESGVSSYAQEQAGRIAAFRASCVPHRDGAYGRRGPRRPRPGGALPCAGNTRARPAAVFRGVRLFKCAVGQHGRRRHHPDAGASGLFSLATKYGRSSGVATLSRIPSGRRRVGDRSRRGRRPCCFVAK